MLWFSPVWSDFCGFQKFPSHLNMTSASRGSLLLFQNGKGEQFQPLVPKHTPGETRLPLLTWLPIAQEAVGWLTFSKYQVLVSLLFEAGGASSGRAPSPLEARGKPRG